jgi:hypothetical protein
MRGEWEEAATSFRDDNLGYYFCSMKKSNLILHLENAAEAENSENPKRFGTCQLVKWEWPGAPSERMTQKKHHMVGLICYQVLEGDSRGGWRVFESSQCSRMLCARKNRLPWPCPVSPVSSVLVACKLNEP